MNIPFSSLRGLAVALPLALCSAACEQHPPAAPDTASRAGEAVEAQFTDPPDPAPAHAAEAAKAPDDAHAQKLLAGSYCLACHQRDRKVVGPAFTDVSRRYAGAADAREQLRENILKGGGGRWGPVRMPAQPQLRDADLERIIDWILQLSPQESPAGKPQDGGSQHR